MTFAAVDPAAVYVPIAVALLGLVGIYLKNVSDQRRFHETAVSRATKAASEAAKDYAQGMVKQSFDSLQLQVTTLVKQLAHTEEKAAKAEQRADDAERRADLAEKVTADCEARAIKLGVLVERLQVRVDTLEHKT